MVLLIAMIEPPTSALYAGFIVVLYAGFPWTVLSQLSTGPMIDRISPVHRRGFAQGLNTTAMNFGQAVFPWILGILADKIGTDATMWISTGISFAAALANVPLIFVSSLKIKKAVPDWDRTIRGDTDKALVEKALSGAWIPARSLERINEARSRAGKHVLAIAVGKYEEDKKNLKNLKRHAKSDYRYYTETFFGLLGSTELDTPPKRQEMIDMFTKAEISDQRRTELEQELGRWAIDYLQDSGYFVHTSPVLFKQMMITAFPRMWRKSDATLTADNVQQWLLNFARFYAHMLEKEENPPFVRAFATSGFYAKD